jgi:hypothetical protein
MALHRIETAPKTQEFIILQDESALVYEVARWSTEKGNWVREHGEPVQITPTHWMPLPDPVCSNSLDGREKRGLRRIRRIGLYAGLCVTAGLAILFLPSLLGNLAGTREKDGVAVHETASPSAENSQIGSSGSADRTRGNRMQTRARDSMLPGEIRSNVRTPPDSAVPTETQQGGQAVQGSAAHQGELVERERQRGEALTRELDSARQEVQALRVGIAEANAKRAEIAQSLQAAEASAVEQRQALEREHLRGEAIARDLASAREEIEAHKIAARAADEAAQEAQASISAQKEALDRERQGAQLVARDLTLSRQEVKALKAAASAAGEPAQTAQTSARELNDALERERRRGDALTHQLASAREEIDALRIAATNAARTEPVVQASAVEQSHTLEQERQRGESLTRELAAAQVEVESLTARLAAADAARTETAQILQIVQTSAAEQSHALKRERQKGESLTHELAAARAEVESLMARLAAIDAAHTETARMLQTSAAAQSHALERERQRGDILEHDLASAREEIRVLWFHVAAARAGLAAPSTQVAHFSPQTASARAASPSKTGWGTGSPTTSVGRGLPADGRTAAEAAGCLSSAAAVRTSQPETRPKWTRGPNGERCWYAGKKPVFERSPRMGPAELRPDRAAVGHAVPVSNVRMDPLPTRRGFFFW